jgi:hypothetical protein
VARRFRAGWLWPVGGFERAGYFVRISLSDFVIRSRYSWP